MNRGTHGDFFLTTRAQMMIQPRLKGTIRTLLQALASAMGPAHYSNTRGLCPHCTANTTWAVRPLNGYYRCLQCGNNPLDASQPPE